MTEAYGLPLFLAASSADLTSATFSDIYGRYSLWSSTFVTPTSPTTCRYYVGIGSNGSGASPSQSSTAYGRDALKPSILLDVEAPKDDKWTIAGGGKTVPVTRYLRNLEDPEVTRKFCGRAFVASDGQHYEWRYRDADEKDPGWTCTTPQGYVVAHFAEHSSSGGALPSAASPYYPPSTASSSSPPSSSTSPASTPTRVKRSSFDFLTRKRRSSSASSFGVVANPDTPGGMLVVNESWTHIAEEILATLIILDRLARCQIK